MERQLKINIIIFSLLISVFLLANISIFPLGTLYATPVNDTRLIGSDSPSSLFFRAFPSNNLAGGESYYTFEFNPPRSDTFAKSPIKTVTITFSTNDTVSDSFDIDKAKLIGVDGLGIGMLTTSENSLTYNVQTPTWRPSTYKIIVAGIVNPITNIENAITLTPRDSNGEIVEGGTRNTTINLIYINQNQIEEAAVITPKIADNAITTEKIKDLAVTPPKLNFKSYIKKVVIQPNVCYERYEGVSSDGECKIYSYKAPLSIDISPDYDPPPFKVYTNKIPFSATPLSAQIDSLISCKITNYGNLNPYKNALLRGYFSLEISCKAAQTSLALESRYITTDSPITIYYIDEK